MHVSYLPPKTVIEVLYLPPKTVIEVLYPPSKTVIQVLCFWALRVGCGEDAPLLAGPCCIAALMSCLLVVWYARGGEAVDICTSQLAVPVHEAVICAAEAGEGGA